jgi:cysteine desulfurase/selenocysteine lyase
MNNPDPRSNAALPATPAQARALFPGALSQTYLDVAARGLLSLPVRQEIDDFLDGAMCGGDKLRMFAAVEDARRGFATLIGAHPDEVAIVKNISEGLNIVATGLEWQPGDNLVLCEELEHANNVYVWRNLQRRLGVEIRNVPMCDGSYDVPAMVAAMDARTRLLTVSTHTFSPGLRTDLEPLAEACAERGAFFLVDGAQTLGIAKLDVNALKLDAIAASTQKGLLGLYGMGFLYVRRARAEAMSPHYLARFGVDLGEQNEAAVGAQGYALMPGARRFDLGNYNYIAAVAVGSALRMINNIGVDRIESHAVGLSTRLAVGLAGLGLPVCGAPAGQHRGHIVCVGRLGEGHDATGDARMQSLYDALQAQGVKLSIRKGTLRFSFHLYNSEEDVERVLAIATAWSRI